MLRPLDDDVLEQIAEAGLDGALVAGLDLEVVGDRALLVDLAVGLHEHGARRVAVAGARRVELLERLADAPRGRRARARATRTDARAPLVLDARARQLRLARRPRDARRLDRRRARGAGRRPPRRGRRRRARTRSGTSLGLDVELRQRLGHAVARRRRVLERVAQRRRRIDAPRTPRCAPPRRRPRALRSRGAPPRSASDSDASVAAARSRSDVARRPPPSRRPASAARAGSRRASSAVELRRHGRRRGRRAPAPARGRTNLLLLAVDGELARVRRLARRGRARLGLDQLDAQPSEIRLRPRRRAPPPPTRARAPRPAAPRADSIVSASWRYFAREQHLLPAPQLVAQPLVAARLRRLALQRAALLLHLEDDVVDAREVLLRGLELQLRRAAARLVLRDAGGFLDQLTPIGRAASSGSSRSCPAR